MEESPEGFEALKLEIETMIAVESSSIIQLFEVYEGEETYYLVMELMEGRSLYELFEKNYYGFQIEECKIIMR